LLKSEPPLVLVEFAAASSKQVGFCQLNVRIGYSSDGHNPGSSAGANQPGAQFASSGSIVF